MPNDKLIISLPRGLYRLTKCGDCKHTFKCDNCDNNLTTIKQGTKNILICSECQQTYPYPKSCPNCRSTEINSMFGGRDYLQDKIDNNEVKADISNRIYDPSLDYFNYTKVIVTHSENLFLGIDYQSVEEVSKSLTELILNLNENTELIFDQKNGLYRFDTIGKPLEWFMTIMEEEKKNRAKFYFPPNNNLILISSYEKSLTQAIAKLRTVREELLFLKENSLPELGTPSQPYEAKMLRRKGMFTMHLYIKYPKNYENITILNTKIQELKTQYRLTVRLNPRHIF
jgi:primosomal protein N'